MNTYLSSILSACDAGEISRKDCAWMLARVDSMFVPAGKPDVDTWTTAEMLKHFESLGFRFHLISWDAYLGNATDDLGYYYYDDAEYDGPAAAEVERAADWYNSDDLIAAEIDGNFYLLAAAGDDDGLASELWDKLAAECSPHYWFGYSVAVQEAA